MFAEFSSISNKCTSAVAATMDVGLLKANVIGSYVYVPVSSM
jgi:hypothetical protein